MTRPAPTTVPDPTPAQVAAYDEGRAAYEAGEESLAVSEIYPAGSESRLLWVRGYTLARRDDLYGRPSEED